LATALDFDVQSVEEQLLGDDRVSEYKPSLKKYWIEMRSAKLQSFTLSFFMMLHENKISGPYNRPMFHGVIQ